MYGVNGKPFISLDEHLDIDGFTSLHDKMCHGIALSYWDQGNYGPGVYDRSSVTDLFWLEADLYNKRHPDSEKVNAMRFFDINQKRKYLKLRYGVYNPSHTVYLKKPNGRDYYSIAKPDSNPWTDNATHFPELVKWIKELPFQDIGRALFFIHEHDCDLVMHSDLKYAKEPGQKYKADQPYESEFVWIRSTPDKSFYVFNENTGEKHYVKGNSAWFNSYDLHGGDREKVMTFSLRVDGKFTDEFRQKLLG